MASEELQNVALQEETLQQVTARSNASTVAYAPFDTPGNVDTEGIWNFQKSMNTLGFGTRIPKVADLQGTSSASSTPHNFAGTFYGKAQVQGIDTAIMELKNNLKTKTVNDAASGSAPQEDLDICFLVDCTGSMGWCIEQVKSKVRSIIDQLHDSHKDAAINVAFVGYRDLNTQDFPAGKFEVHDFVGRDEMNGLQAFLNTITSLPNHDSCEDVAGGLLHALDLSWKSPIRLVIHFCDDPCHGLKYHSAESSDHWPEGDPRGYTIEDLMQQLCSRGISYYFAAITTRTDQMARIMQECYANNVNVEFKIMAWKDARTSFAPTVLRSVHSSIQHSRSAPMSTLYTGGPSTRHYSPFRAN